MHRFAFTFRCSLFAATFTCISVCAAAQSSAVPPTAPTQSVSDLPSARPATLPYQPHGAIGTKAVQWDGSVLAIHASGEDLPAILSEVARLTHLKITGGVPDERVFGVYGPGSVQQVLSDLFNGLYVNLLLVNDTATQPKELILTPRTGGPTPPSPARSIAYEPPPTRPERPFRESSAPAGAFGPPQFQPAGVAPASVPAPDANATPDANGQPQSPNGVRTPEQIFEELRKRQAAQQGATTQ